MPAPRRQRGQEEPPPWDAPQWPLLKEQQALQAQLDSAEVAAAQQRAQALVSQGYGPLRAWLLSDPSPAELDGIRRAQQAQQQALDFFED